LFQPWNFIPGITSYASIQRSFPQAAQGGILMPVIPFPEKEYYLNEAQALLLVMLADKADSQKAGAMRKEMINILMAWRRGKLAPRSAAPDLTALLDCLQAGSV
jgi:hypothetical protein